MPVRETVIIKSRIPSCMPSRGFTIIEILVTITIVSLFVGATYAGFSQFSKRQSLIAAGQTLKNILRDAQSRAFTGETDCTICDCTVNSTGAQSWYADFVTRELYGKCSGNTFFHTKFGIADNITITSLMTPNQGVLFRLPPAAVTPTGTVCLSTTDLPGYYYQVHVDESGNVSDSGALDASCTP